MWVADGWKDKAEKVQVGPAVHGYDSIHKVLVQERCAYFASHQQHHLTNERRGGYELSKQNKTVQFWGKQGQPKNYRNHIEQRDWYNYPGTHNGPSPDLIGV